MGAGPSGGGGNTNQVSGNEAFYTKQQKQLQKKTMNTDQEVTTYGDTKTGRTFGGEYSKENQNPNNNIQKQKKKTTNTYGGGNGGGNGGEGAGAENVLKGNAVPGGVGGPTKAEVSQSEAANADADTEANRLLKIKKKGRSQSIISGSQGVTKTSTDYSLGKKSLLGRV